MESVEQLMESKSTKTWICVELSEGLGRFGRESRGWFIYVPQIYHLGKKVE